MTCSIVRINVLDYARWRAGFEASADARRSYGASGKSEVYRDRDNPNMLTVILEWKDEGKARQWFQSPELQEAQQKAGVTQMLEMRFSERV